MSIRYFRASGFITGDYECFCLADQQDPSKQDQDKRIYPNDWFKHLDKNTMYDFVISVEAREVETNLPQTTCEECGNDYAKGYCPHGK